MKNDRCSLGFYEVRSVTKVCLSQCMSYSICGHLKYFPHGSMDVLLRCLCQSWYVTITKHILICYNQCQFWYSTISLPILICYNLYAQPDIVQSLCPSWYVTISVSILVWYNMPIQMCLRSSWSVVIFVPILLCHDFYSPLDMLIYILIYIISVPTLTCVLPLGHVTRWGDGCLQSAAGVSQAARHGDTTVLLRWGGPTTENAQHPQDWLLHVWWVKEHYRVSCTLAKVTLSMCVCVCVRVRACGRACRRACVHACMRVWGCGWVCGWVGGCADIKYLIYLYWT